MVYAESRTGPVASTDGAISVIRADRTGAVVGQDIHGKFYESVKRGNVFVLSGQSAAATAYTGAAAGTPLLAIYNPSNSGKDLSILQINIALGSSGTTAALVDFEAFAGVVTAIGSGTTTAPRNIYTQAQAGSIATGFVNTALTSQTGAMNLITGVGGGGANPGTTAPNTTSTFLYNADGIIVIAPGNMLAIGSRTTLASGAITYSVIWEEITV